VKARLQRQEKDAIKKVLESLRFGPDKKRLRVMDSTEYVWGYLGDEPVIGFRWEPKKGWRVYLTFLLHTHGDLEMVAFEVRRIASCTSAMEEAWNNYRRSRSDKNWLHYQGCVAALFMGEEIK